jgi:hypothetical protein
MKTKQHYGAKEYFGDRPCIDPVVMQYLQVKLRSVQANPARNETLIGKIKNIIEHYTK